METTITIKQVDVSEPSPDWPVIGQFYDQWEMHLVTIIPDAGAQDRDVQQELKGTLSRLFPGSIITVLHDVHFQLARFELSFSPWPPELASGMRDGVNEVTLGVTPGGRHLAA